MSGFQSEFFRFMVVSWYWKVKTLKILVCMSPLVLHGGYPFIANVAIPSTKFPGSRYFFQKSKTNTCDTWGHPALEKAEVPTSDCWNTSLYFQDSKHRSLLLSPVSTASDKSQAEKATVKQPILPHSLKCTQSSQIPWKHRSFLNWLAEHFFLCYRY